MPEKPDSPEELFRTTMHNLNNLLFVVSGKVELLLMEEKVSGKIKQDLEVMSGNLEKIRQLINDSVARYKEMTKRH